MRHDDPATRTAARLPGDAPAPRRSRRSRPAAPRAVAGARTTNESLPTADTVIVLWMAGGMAHTETFDPKRYTPFEQG